MITFLRKLPWLLHRRSREENLGQELQFHLEEEAEELRRSGLREEDARWAARRELGNLTRVKEDAPAAWGWPVVPLSKPRPEKVPTGHGGFDSRATHTLGIGPGFFSTLHIPLLAGWEFDERDNSKSLPVAIVAVIEQRLRPQIFFARLCTGFAVLALAIACVGLYGTMSCNIVRRSGERCYGWCSATS